jgi:2-iminobutanoate/2-iminopropanoate deaminase
MLFVSGQLGMDTTGELASGVEEQTRLSLKNLVAILEDAGTSPQQVVKTTCFLANMDDFPTFNRIYGEVFTDDPPARSCIAVKTLPKNALVEVEAIAIIS